MQVLYYQLLGDSELFSVCVSGNLLVTQGSITWPTTFLTLQLLQVYSLVPDLEPGNSVSLPNTCATFLVSHNDGHVYLGCLEMVLSWKSARQELSVLPGT